MAFWTDFIWSWSITVILFTVVTTFVATLWWYYVKDEESESKDSPVAEKAEKESSTKREEDLLKDIRDALLHNHPKDKIAALHDKVLLKPKNREWETTDSQRLKDMLMTYIKTETRALVRTTDLLIQYLKENNNKSINISEITSLHTLNVLYSVAFGKSFDLGDKRLVDIKNELETILKLWPDFSTDSQLSTESESLEFTNAKGEFLTRITQVILQHAKSSNPYEETVFEQLLQFEEENESEEYLFIFFICAYTTMAKFFSSAALLVAENPDVQEKIFKNLTDNIFLEEGTFLVMYPFIQATIQEILRITEIVPFAARCTESEKTDSEDKKSTGCTFSKIDLTQALANDQYWENPEKFDPSRFLDEKGKLVEKKAYIAFSIDSRICPGKNILELAGRIFLTSVVKHCLLSIPEPPPNNDEDSEEPPLILVSVREQKEA